MDKLKTALSNLLSKIFSDYQHGGGVIKIANVDVDPDVASGSAGAAPALVWLAEKFYADYQIEFPAITYKPDAAAQTGFSIDRIDITGSPSAFLLLMTSFLRDEVFPANVVEVELDVLLDDFSKWCHENVMQTRHTLPSIKSHPEDSPE